MKKDNYSTSLIDLLLWKKSWLF